MTVGERAGLRAYAKSLQPGEATIETDWATYYGLMTQASDRSPPRSAKLNLIHVPCTKLGKTEFKELVHLQGSIRKGDDKKAEAALDGFRTNQQILDDTLKLAGHRHQQHRGGAQERRDQRGRDRSARRSTTRSKRCSGSPARRPRTTTCSSSPMICSPASCSSRAAGGSILPYGAPFKRRHQACGESHGRRYSETRPRADSSRRCAAPGRPGHARRPIGAISTSRRSGSRARSGRTNPDIPGAAPVPRPHRRPVCRASFRT